ncbi:hypothetical protein GCM10011321_10740 [Youhaiella tibetensis]|nr:hypothetical protein GCM10011321_10740 [Youhaiella tibetensis]
MPDHGDDEERQKQPHLIAVGIFLSANGTVLHRLKIAGKEPALTTIGAAASQPVPDGPLP